MSDRDRLVKFMTEGRAQWVYIKNIAESMMYQIEGQRQKMDGLVRDFAKIEETLIRMESILDDIAESTEPQKKHSETDEDQGQSGPV